MLQTIESNSHRRIFSSLLAQKPRTRSQPLSSIRERAAGSIDSPGNWDAAVSKRGVQKQLTPVQNGSLPHAEEMVGAKKSYSTLFSLRDAFLSDFIQVALSRRQRHRGSSNLYE